MLPRCRLEHGRSMIILNLPICNYGLGGGNVGGFFSPRFSVATQTFLRRRSEPVLATGLSGAGAAVCVAGSCGEDLNTEDV